ncbi:hypothetical protein HDU93_006697 [Gonapodya sp. JEL0774]|nr:hypothetical protein HDU93_006697 [Gonapodya sp. JEL0774]
MSFFGLFNFTAPYLPFVLAGFSIFVGNQWPVGDLVGMAVAHVYFWAEDVWPHVLDERRRAAGLPPPLPGEEWSLFKAPTPFRNLVDSLIAGRRTNVDPFATLDAAGVDPIFVPEHTDVGGTLGYGLGAAVGVGIAAAGNGPQNEVQPRNPAGVLLGFVSRVLGAVGLAHLVGGPAPQVDGWRRQPTSDANSSANGEEEGRDANSSQHEAEPRRTVGEQNPSVSSEDDLRLRSNRSAENREEHDGD